MPPALAAWLRSQGHDAVHLLEIGLLESPDSAIWDYAASNSATMISKDEDFAQLVDTNPAGPALVWIRYGNLRKRALLARVQAGWPEVMEHLRSGAKLVEMR